MAYLSGFVGRHGRHGCRLYRSAVGRHTPGGPGCYPAFLKPHSFTAEGCDLGDLWYASVPTLFQREIPKQPPLPHGFANETQHKKCRLETGVPKPSISLGLQPKKIPGALACFGSDAMHLGALNLPDLLVNLWRGTLGCDRTGDRSTWVWAKLKGRAWEEYRQKVTAATRRLPGSFDRPLRNPAEKISSGCKAWELLLYFYGLRPGLFLGILPHTCCYSYCELVFGMRIINQHQFDAKDLLKAHGALLQFACEFEVPYYQRRTDRPHFVRQSTQAVAHLAQEALGLGPHRSG